MKWISAIVLIVAMVLTVQCLYAQRMRRGEHSRPVYQERRESTDTRQIDPGPLFKPADESELHPADIYVEPVIETDRDQDKRESEEPEEQATPINIPEEPEEEATPINIP